MKGVTKRQLEILQFIDKFTDDHKIAPSFREIGAEFGYSSLGTVYAHVENLKKKGFLSSKKRTPRSLETKTESQGQPGIHLIGFIQGTLPLETLQTISEHPVPPSLLPPEKECYLIEIRGMSYLEECIQDRDLLIVVPEAPTKGGELVIALIDRHTTLIKRLFHEGQFVRFESANPTLSPLILRDEDVEIQGTVYGLIRNYAESAVIPCP